MSKTTKKVQGWNNRNPFNQGARLRKAGAIEDRRMRRANDAGRNWEAEWEAEDAEEQAYWDAVDREFAQDMGETE